MKKNLILFSLITFILVVVYYNQKTPIRFPSSNQIGLLPDNSYDLSIVEPNEFKKAMQYRVLNLLRINNNPMATSFEFGHFLMSDENGQKVRLCDAYPYIELQFNAEGMAISGTPPQIKITARCIPTADDSHIEAISLSTDENPNVQIQILPEQDPPITREIDRWYLNKIVFYNSDQKSLTIDGYQILETLGQPINMTWPPNE